MRVSITFLLLLDTSHSSSLSIGPSADALTNTLRPLTDCFLTIRVIKSFEFRTTKNMLLPHVDVTTMTVGQLKDEVRTREFLRWGVLCGATES